VTAVIAEQIQELLDRLAIAAGRGPHQPAAVVVDDHRQVSLALADRDLIDPDPREPGEQVTALKRFVSDTLADPADRSPRNAHQL